MLFLHLFNGDCVAFANFHAALTAEAFIFIDRLSLAVYDLIYVNGAYIDTFGVTSAFVFVNSNLPSHLTSS
jgi:hypothetical protein